MNDPDYIIRNYRPEDFDNLVRFWAEVEKIGQRWCRTMPHDIIENLGQPNHFPGNDLFLAERAGNIVGYIDVMPELNIGRVVLNCGAHPEHGKKGSARRLVKRAIDRAKELGAKMVHVNIPQDNVKAKKLFTKMGFKFVRLFLEMRLDIAKAYWPKNNKIALSYRHMRHAEEDKLMQIQNRSFADTWGYNPNTIEEIIYRTSLPDSSPEDIILACDADTPIGYCWTRRKSGENHAISGDKGRIYMLGVDPDHRGKRVGKHLLLAGLSLLKGKGLRMVELTVDSENIAACDLYRSVGFQVWKSSLWYEMVLG